MGLLALVQVWYEAQPKTASQMLVLMALADYADDDGWCWPSVETIARRSHLSERTVQRTLIELKGLGELTIHTPMTHKIHDGEVLELRRDRRPNRYRLLPNRTRVSVERGVRLAPRLSPESLTHPGDEHKNDSGDTRGDVVAPIIPIVDHQGVLIDDSGSDPRPLHALPDSELVSAESRAAGIQALRDAIRRHPS